MSWQQFSAGPGIHGTAEEKLREIADRQLGQEWSHSVTNQTLDLIEHIPGTDERFMVVCSTTVRIQLSNGIFHEHTGYANATGDKNKAIILAKKKSVFEAMKNAMSWFSSSIAQELRFTDFQ